MTETVVGVIGGSGLYEIEGLTDVREAKVSTPFGDPSDTFVLGRLAGIPVAFLPRHGRGHRISPSELPSQANIWAMKSLGVTHLLSISAVGSLCEDIAPRDVVIPDQLIDRTKGLRPATFFGRGLVVHVGFADPFCPDLRRILYDAVLQVGVTGHDRGTLVVMEGPQFSTRAESLWHRQCGAHLIGMTALPEAKLAREAEICYCTVAMVTDYDCWHESLAPVTAEMVVGNLVANVGKAKEIIRKAIPQIAAAKHECACSHALADAIITQRTAIPKERVKELGLLIGQYLL
jgi:5'-methylthioadenosine phosphorylase